MKRVVPMHDDLFDFFYEAMPGYEKVGLRRTLLGCWGAFQDPDVCNFEYRDMTDWGRSDVRHAGRRGRRQARHHRPGGDQPRDPHPARQLVLRGLGGQGDVRHEGSARETRSTARHPWNQHTIPKPQKRDFDEQVQLGDVAALVRRQGPPRARHRRRPARAAVGDRARGPGRHRLRQGDRAQRRRSTCRGPRSSPR